MQMHAQQRAHWQHRLIVALLLPFLVSCTPVGLSARMEYVSRKSLASYRVKTPDPYLNTPPIGQRLLISWSLPKAAQHLPDLYLRITLRFRNGVEQVQNHKICKFRGRYQVCLLNEQYLETCGIQTYKVEILGGGQVLLCWHHQLFTELIHIECD